MIHLRPPCSSQHSTETLAVDRFRSCHSAVDTSEELASYGRGRVVSIPSVVVVVVSLESELMVSSVSFPELMHISFRVGHKRRRPEKRVTPEDAQCFMTVSSVRSRRVTFASATAQFSVQYSH